MLMQCCVDYSLLRLETPNEINKITSGITKKLTTLAVFDFNNILFIKQRTNYRNK